MSWSLLKPLKGKGRFAMLEMCWKRENEMECFSLKVVYVFSEMVFGSNFGWCGYSRTKRDW